MMKVSRRDVLLAASAIPLQAVAASAQTDSSAPQPAAPAAPAAPAPSGGATAAPKDAYVYFIWPQDGTRIKGAFWCRFGLRNMGVTHAGDNRPNAGHHHLLIDVNDPISPTDPIPSDKNHLHFGGGQTEGRLDLPKGKHTLQLVLGDADHKPFNPMVASKKITITVY